MQKRMGMNQLAHLMLKYSWNCFFTLFLGRGTLVCSDKCVASSILNRGEDFSLLDSISCTLCTERLHNNQTKCFFPGHIIKMCNFSWQGMMAKRPSFVPSRWLQKEQWLVLVMITTSISFAFRNCTSDYLMLQNTFSYENIPCLWIPLLIIKRVGGANLVLICCCTVAQNQSFGKIVTAVYGSDCPQFRMHSCSHVP